MTDGEFKQKKMYDNFLKYICSEVYIYKKFQKKVPKVLNVSKLLLDFFLFWNFCTETHNFYSKSVRYFKNIKN